MRFRWTILALSLVTVASVSFSADKPKPADCVTAWGERVPHGADVIAYQAPSAEDCKEEARICFDGELSGRFQYAACSPTPAKKPAAGR
jgi:hypothetical protein